MNIFTSDNGDFSISYPSDWTAAKQNIFDSWVEFSPTDKTSNPVLD